MLSHVFLSVGALSENNIYPKKRGGFQWTVIFYMLCILHGIKKFWFSNYGATKTAYFFWLNIKLDQTYIE